MNQDRKYQQAATAAIETCWNEGATAPCLVAPTGSGKTVICASLVRERRTLWAAHTRELVRQASGELAAMYGRANVGEIMPEGRANPTARIQVGTVETILSRAVSGNFDLVVIDEVHHYVSARWRHIRTAFPGARYVGATATPERADGTPLGDICDALVVAASYSELLKLGLLVPIEVIRPTEFLGTDIAMDPIEAWVDFANGRRTFAFFRDVLEAFEHSARWRHRGVRAETVQYEMDSRRRDDIMALFRIGQLTVLSNVYALTEGVNVPEAEVMVTTRGFEHPSTMLQAAGRIMRPSPGKTSALMLDLAGCTHLHGDPLADRNYSLAGRAIVPREPIEREYSGRSRSNIVNSETLERAFGGLATPVEIRKTDGQWRPSVPTEKLHRVRAKHGRKAMLDAAKYFDTMGE